MHERSFYEFKFYFYEPTFPPPAASYLPRGRLDFVCLCLCIQTLLLRYVCVCAELRLCVSSPLHTHTQLDYA